MTCDVIQKTLWRATVSVSWVTRILGVVWRGVVKELSAGPSTLLTTWIFGCNFVPKFGAVTGCSWLVARITSEAQVRSKTCPYEVCGGHSGTGTGVPVEYVRCPPSARWRQCSMLIHSCIPSTLRCRKTRLSSKIWGGIYSKALCSCLLAELCARTERCKFRRCNTLLLLAFHTMHWRLHRIDLVLL
jgi:hypothetical protein